MLKFADPEHTLTNPIDKQLSHILHRLFALEPNFNWESFESFHPLFESLRRVLAPGITTLEKAYPMARHHPSFVPSSIEFDSIVDNKFYLPNFLQHKYPSNDFKPKENGVVGSVNKFFIPARGNSGFDSFVLQRSGTQTIALCIENRWSDVDSKTIMNLNDIKDKAKVVSASYKGIGRDFGVTCDNFCLIIIAFRGLTSFENSELPMNTLVLDKKLFTICMD